jgi:hypothetical protein
MLVVVVALVAVLVVARVLLFDERLAGSGGRGCSTGGPGLGGSGFAIGTATPSGGPSNNSYNMFVNPSSGMQWSDLRFQVVDSRGANLSPESDWGALALGPPAPNSGQPIAGYSFQTQQWNPGASVLMKSGETLTLELGSSDLRSQGDQLVVSVTPSCGLSGVHVSLP